MVLLGIKITLRSLMAAACWAAMIMFELLGSTKTFLAFARRMALVMLSMLGFMV